jgi:hypothetical protein
VVPNEIDHFAGEMEVKTAYFIKHASRQLFEAHTMKLIKPLWLKHGE